MNLVRQQYQLGLPPQFNFKYHKFSCSQLKMQRSRIRGIAFAKEETTAEVEQINNSATKPKTTEKTTQLPQIFTWVASLLVIIGIFYSVVFYAGAGFFYLVKDKITFTKKDFIPYSERLALERQERLETQESTISEPESSDESLRYLLPINTKQ
eukprot:TRINITY_DN7979_c0_g1_i1.p4 TRINITY_DN7979_c0_g1~~TRINITY_DN7979_c0_g1_i1.p4  ORF type:complete len:154 (-),score=14.18 TRINITY_DN7979_c0_g1_i1:531-992(-)